MSSLKPRRPRSLRSHLTRSLLGAAIAATTAGTAATYATPAAACGGFFCDTGPQSMPVDQSGENIIFAFDNNTVEVHIQIEYDPETDAEKFSWIIPMQSLPEFAVGSEPLFDNVLAGTVPFYGLNTTLETCGGDDSFNGDPGAGGLTGGTSSDGTDSGWGTGDDGEGGPTILFEETVGAFDITVLESKDAKELLDWLDANDYSYDASAIPIIEAYLDEGNLFAAFKLAPADTPVIHPITLRYQGNEPCVPIRLTRVAAVEDMDIRVFFLGDARAIPTNYRHVLVNPLKIDWPNFAANYKEVITAAVDAFKAEGNAFVTEYAGPSDVISQFGLHSAQWAPKAFEGLPALNAIDTLKSQGILDCWNWGESSTCEYRHPLLEGLLHQYLPVPQGLQPDDFWDCLSCYEDMIDAEAWGDGAGFAKDYDERIVTPGLKALELLQRKPYVTRMYTTISPHEMNEDPMFAENRDLPEVARIRTAEKLNRCDGHAEYTLPDGRVVFVPDDGPWPEFPLEMPWEEGVQQMTMAGAPQELSNNTETIDAILEAWNLEHRPAYDTAGATAGGDESSEGGCGCTNGSSGSGGFALGLGIFGLLALRRRRSA